MSPILRQYIRRRLQCCLHFRQRQHQLFQLISIKIGKQKPNVAAVICTARTHPRFCLEPDQIRRTPAAGLPFAKRLDKIGRKQVSYHICDSRSAQSRCANQVCARAYTGFAQKSQDTQSVGMPQDRRPTDWKQFLLHSQLATISKCARNELLLHHPHTESAEVACSQSFNNSKSECLG